MPDERGILLMPSSRASSIGDKNTAIAERVKVAINLLNKYLD